MNPIDQNSTSALWNLRKALRGFAMVSLLLTAPAFAQPPKAPDPAEKSPRQSADRDLDSLVGSSLSKGDLVSDPKFEWVARRFCSSDRSPIRWSVDPNLTKAFEPSGVFEELIHCRGYHLVYNSGLKHLGARNPNTAEDTLLASVLMFKGEQRVFVGRAKEFSDFKYDAEKNVLSFYCWTGALGNFQALGLEFDLSRAEIEPEITMMVASGLPDPSPTQLQFAKRTKHYDLKFEGKNVLSLEETLRQQLAATNVVVGRSVREVEVPPFELRNVKLGEIGRAIEFVTEGKLRVEIPEDSNMWLIDKQDPGTGASALRMRSIAAPHLFADEKALTAIQEAVLEMENHRIEMIGAIGGEGSTTRRATATPLKNQRIFMITGDEVGVAGLESLIKAAEELAKGEHHNPNEELKAAGKSANDGKSEP